MAQEWLKNVTLQLPFISARIVYHNVALIGIAHMFKHKNLVGARLQTDENMRHVAKFDRHSQQPGAQIASLCGGEIPFCCAQFICCNFST